MIDRLESYRSVNMFPYHMYTKKPERTMALFTGDSVVTENGDIYRIDDYESLVSLLFDRNLLVFTDNVSASFRFINDAIVDPNCKILCSKKGVPLSVRFSRRGFSRWLASFSTWNISPSLESLSLLRDTFSYVGTGVYSTPGALGRSVLLETWKSNHLARYTMVNGFAQRFIRSHMSGGRADTPGLGQSYDLVLEYDEVSEYLSKFVKNPVGTSVPFKRRSPDMFETWFAECSVMIRNELPLGPFPVRDGERISYPSLPGEYTAYLWREQAEQSEQIGCIVRPLQGYGFWETTGDTAYWCYSMYDLKRNAPNDDVEGIIKKSIVATIGGHGMSNMFYMLVPEHMYQVGDTPLMENGNAYDYLIRQYTDYNTANMIHWYAYNTAMASVDLFDVANYYAFQGKLVCTNYDSVMIHSPAPDDYEWCKPRTESKSLPPGSWRWEELHDVKVVAPRSIISKEKTTLPGVPYDERENIETD